jgi:hypothetical protein
MSLICPYVEVNIAGSYKYDGQEEVRVSMLQCSRISTVAKNKFTFLIGSVFIEMMI